MSVFAEGEDFERDFVYDYTTDGELEYREDELSYEDGTLCIILREVHPQWTSLRSPPRVADSIPARYSLSASKPQTDVDSHSDRSWLLSSAGMACIPAGNGTITYEHTSESNAESTKCYLVNTGFRGPDRNVVLVQNLQEGSTVLLSDERVARVTMVKEFPRMKKRPYDLCVFGTSQGTFEISANHRIATPNGAKLARDLVVGNQVIVGSKVQPLLTVSQKKAAIALYQVSFSPDGNVEAFSIPKFGIQTLGEPPAAERFAEPPATESASGASRSG
eukprot:CAMPEP_0172922560 /NCGR_PEP_ID=MMETSP1075-20121228/208065_1 /TAXON_ID=2916 /ORGANISM="Ceratium fusus, Strain PA161109" /LENGTH=275 /DNA_ID=CAMNT_0013782895 /DNA_START=14 /DNA_END=838 /DNA_ORIENTATION=+